MLLRDAARGRSDASASGRRLTLIQLKAVFGLPAGLVMSVQPVEYAQPDSAVRQAVSRVMTRAALLHTDVAIGWAKHGPEVPVSRQPTGRARPAVFQIRDGRRSEIIDLNIHWEIARAAFDLVGPPEAGSPFARQWYLATSTRLVGERDYAVATHHLDHARRVFPDEPRLWLLAGMIDENLAAPSMQAAIAQVDPRAFFNVESVRTLFDRAERSYWKALELDAGLADAAVRLAHVFLRTDRPSEAVDLLRQAPESREVVMQYFAVLVLGQAERALGRLDAARDAFNRARSLFPDAQSPRLALAELAWHDGQPQSAADGLAAWLAMPQASPAAARFDPWWYYDVAPAADASLRLAELYQGAERLR
jgi:tetratricopeptide (TPR) repeat protein